MMNEDEEEQTIGALMQSQNPDLYKRYARMQRRRRRDSMGADDGAASGMTVSEADALRGENAQLKLDVLELSREVERLTGSSVDIDTAKDLYNKYALLHNELSVAQETNDLLIKRAEEAEASLQTRERKRLDSADMCNHLRAWLSEAKASLAASQEQVRTGTEAMDTLKADNAAAVDALQAELDKAKKEAVAADNRAADWKTKFEQAEALLAERDDSIQALKTTAEQLRGDLAGAKEDATAANARIGEWTALHEQSQKEVARLKTAKDATIQTQAVHIKQLEADLARAKTSANSTPPPPCRQCKLNKDAAAKEVADMFTKMSDKNDELADLKDVVKKLTAENERCMPVVAGLTAKSPFQEGDTLFFLECVRKALRASPTWGVLPMSFLQEQEVAGFQGRYWVFGVPGIPQFTLITPAPGYQQQTAQ